VTLTVTDDSGQTTSASHQITVAQGLIVATVVYPPAIIYSKHPSTTRSGRVDLGQRLFCPGAGPSCTATITTTSSGLHPAHQAKGRRKRQKTSSSAGGQVITVAQNGSTELTFKLSSQAVKVLRHQKRLPIKVTITGQRFTERVTLVLSSTLKPPAKKKS
jgi:hypothetical protein